MVESTRCQRLAASQPFGLVRLLNPGTGGSGSSDRGVVGPLLQLLGDEPTSVLNLKGDQAHRASRGCGGDRHSGRLGAGVDLDSGDYRAGYFPIHQTDHERC